MYDSFIMKYYKKVKGLKSLLVYAAYLCEHFNLILYKFSTTRKIINILKLNFNNFLPFFLVMTHVFQEIPENGIANVLITILL